jgi:SAM-dependent methyltransferase
VRYCRCERCGSSLATVQPTGAQLQQEYEGDYPQRFPPARLTAERASLFEALLDRLASLGLGGDRPRLLDVGGGGGHLSGLARARRWLAVSADLAHQACVVARRGGEVPAVQADGGLLPFGSGTVDVVTLVNVVDQAREPLTVVREAHRVLRAGGLLAVRVPNARFHRPWVRFLTALGPLARSRRWDAYPIVHHFAFTPEGLRRLAERAGFAVLEVGNSAVAAREPATEFAATARLPRWGRVAIAASAGALAAVSRDRCLVGPPWSLRPKGPRRASTSRTRSRGSRWAARPRTPSPRASPGWRRLSLHAATSIDESTRRRSTTRGAADARSWTFRPGGGRAARRPGCARSAGPADRSERPAIVHTHTSKAGFARLPGRAHGRRARSTSRTATSLRLLRRLPTASSSRSSAWS